MAKTDETFEALYGQLEEKARKLEQGSCGLDFAGGPGNCGAVDPRPDTSSPHVPYDGESFHLIDILKREERPGP